MRKSRPQREMSLETRVYFRERRSRAQAERRNDRARAISAQLVAAWTDVPVGTAVVVTKDHGEQFPTRTRSLPYLLGDGSPVIMVEGITGCYALERVRQVSAGVGR